MPALLAQIDTAMGLDGGRHDAIIGSSAGWLAPPHYSADRHRLMRQWYERYYAAIERSEAYGNFCARVFGADLGQHGFADMEQVHQLVDALAIRTGERVLDVGCGGGGILATIAAETGAYGTGIDFCGRAIANAQARYGSEMVHFGVADMSSLCFAMDSFDVILSIDTLYFGSPRDTLAACADILRPSGRMGFLYGHGADPENPLPTFDRGTLAPACTPVGVALEALGLPFIARDITEVDRQHAVQKKVVLEELELGFIAEGNEFLFRNRYGEANGVLAAIEAGAHARYLYVVSQIDV